MVHFLGFDYKAACGLAWPLLFLDVYGEKRYTIYVLYSLIFPRSYPRARCYRARGFSFPPWPPGKRINLRAAAFSRAIAIYSFSNAYRCLSDTAACCGTPTRRLYSSNARATGPSVSESRYPYRASVPNGAAWSGVWSKIPFSHALRWRLKHWITWPRLMRRSQTSARLQKTVSGFGDDVGS